MPNELGGMPSITEVVEYYLGSVDLCPFHHDVEAGSFKINVAKNYVKCFSCGIIFGPVEFIMNYNNIEKWEAIKVLQSKFGYQPNSSSYSSLSKSLDIKDTFKPLNNNLMNFVYEEYSKSSLLINSPILSKEDEIYLLSRGVKDLSYYFSMPSIKVSKLFFERLEDYGIELNDNFRVPGLYFDLNKRKWTFSESKGIGIKIKEEDSNIRAIQVRSTNPNTKSKYFYFSSSFGESIDFSNGCSVGIPIEVVMPKKLLKRNKIAVTEGHFKALELAALGYIAISVPGVSNYYKVIEKILHLVPIYNVDKVFLAFDADMEKNVGVALCTAMVANSMEKNNVKSEILKWDAHLNGENTKGFDDLRKIVPIENLSNVVKILDGAVFQRKFFKIYDRLKELGSIANNRKSSAGGKIAATNEFEKLLATLF